MDHHVEPAEAFDSLGHCGFDVAGGGHVAAHEDGFVPGGPDRLCDGLARGRPPGGDHHRRTGVGQRSGDACSDALAGTGHHRDLALEHSAGRFRGHPAIQAPPSITSDAPVRPAVAGSARLSITAAISATEGSRPSAGSCRALASTAEAACSGARNMDG